MGCHLVFYSTTKYAISCGRLSISYVLQLSGRAGRNGCTSLSHLFTNKSEQKSCKDSALLSVVAEKSTAYRRNNLVAQLGSNENLPSLGGCCDVCGPQSTSTFKFLAPIRVTRKARPKPLRDVSPQVLSLMKARLLRERGRLIGSNMKYKALGGTVACPVASINEICNRIRYIKDFQYVCDIPCIPHLFAESFFKCY